MGPILEKLAGLQMGLYAAAADNDDCGLVEAVRPEWRPSEPEGEPRPPESNGESREGVDLGEALSAEETAIEVAVEVPLLLTESIFLADFMREAKLNFSLALGGGCCLACCLHLARRFLNHT